MSPSREYLERCSTETGFQAGALEKVARLGEMAADIGRHPFLGAVLALKGGSALNLCFGPPERLSVDLDYNYVGHLDREEMLADRVRVENAIEELARRHGYRTQRSPDAFAGRKLYLAFSSVLGRTERIEVDLNFLFRNPLAGTVTLEMWQPGELDRARVRVVSPEELCTGKLLALLDRTAARDVWDAGRLPTTAGYPLASPLFRPLFVALSAILDHPLDRYEQRHLEVWFSDRSVSQQLVPMLAGDERPCAAELIKDAWAVLRPFLILEPREKEYIDAIYSGEVRAGLLFPDDAERAECIARHPAIQWKILNVRERARKIPPEGTAGN